MKKIYRDLELQELIQVQPPMLMLDQASFDSASDSAAGIKAISINENFFNGHFPGNPIMPGVLQIAAMVQLGSGLYKTSRQAMRNSLVQAVRLDRIKFRKPVFPGDLMQVKVTIVGETEKQGIVIAAQSEVDGQTVCQGSITLEPLKPETLQPAGLEPPPGLPSEFNQIELSPENFFTTNQIAAVIPHRYPFLLLDRILHLAPDNTRTLALKNISANEAFFSGVKNPAVPLFMMAEMGAQAGCFMALKEPENQNKLGYFMSIDQAVAMRPAIPGEQLVFDARKSGTGRFGKGEAKVYSGGIIIAEIALKFAMIDKPSDN